MIRTCTVLLFLTWGIQQCSVAQTHKADSLRKAMSRQLQLLDQRVEQKVKASIPISRGADPCYRDLERMRTLSGLMVQSYKNCCDATESYNELVGLLMELNGLLENKECLWEDNPTMYLLALFVLSDMSSQMEDYPCDRICDCGGCE